jgi:Fuc2NAc and GlcNAc transferase
VTAGTWTAALAVAAFALSWALTGVVRRYALRWLLDHPNERSSHVKPTPKGGGLALILAFLGAGTALAWAGVVETRTALAILPGTAAIAVVGWIDDHRSLRNLVRFAVHLVAAAWTMFWLKGLPVIHFGAAEVRVGVAGWLLGVVAIAWAINLYNFMDGIDGLAGGEAASVGAVAALLLWLRGAPELAALALVLAAAAGGFLVWNWHPARIFMGDVGSGAVGYAFGAMAAASERTGSVPAVIWLILLGVFFGDATLTVARRIAHGEPFFHAHRSHAYQRAVLSGLSHARVTATSLVLNAGLALLAAAALFRPRLFLPAVLAAAAILLVVYLRVERAVPHARAYGSKALSDA